MKKFFTTLLLLVICTCLLAGCSIYDENKSNEQNNQAQNSNSYIIGPQSPLQKGDKIVNNIGFTYIKGTITTESHVFSATYKVYKLTFTFYNNSNSNKAIYSDGFKITFNKNKNQKTLTNEIYFNDSIKSLSIPANDSLTNSINFKISENDYNIINEYTIRVMYNNKIVAELK